jgi:hypothetical protein
MKTPAELKIDLARNRAKHAEAYKKLLRLAGQLVRLDAAAKAIVRRTKVVRRQLRDHAQRYQPMYGVDAQAGSVQ